MSSAFFHNQFRGPSGRFDRLDHFLRLLQRYHGIGIAMDEQRWQGGMSYQSRWRKRDGPCLDFLFGWIFAVWSKKQFTQQLRIRCLAVPIQQISGRKEQRGGSDARAE